MDGLYFPAGIRSDTSAQPPPSATRRTSYEQAHASPGVPGLGLTKRRWYRKIRWLLQVVNLMRCHVGSRTGVLGWPPPAEVLQATGCVGFGDIHQVQDTKPSGLIAEDVTLPPMIRSLHPKLAASAYARHRRDPLFLYKVSTRSEDMKVRHCIQGLLLTRTLARRVSCQFGHHRRRIDDFRDNTEHLSFLSLGSTFRPTKQ